MNPGFGFSAGDFIIAIKVCIKISKALKSTGGSASEYQHVVLELENLQHVLSHLQALEPNASNVNHVNAIRGMALACMLPLQDFLAKIKKYEATMGAFASRSIKGAADKTKWAVYIAEEVQKLRTLISAKVLSITLLLSTQTSETVSRLESRGGRQHNDLMSKILQQRSQLDVLSKNIEEMKKGARFSHQESKSDFSELRNEVGSKFDNIMASSSSVSADLNNVYATTRATRSSIEKVSKDLTSVSTTVDSAQSTLGSLRNIGFQAKRFFHKFPTELRGLLENILRTNMQMYSMLLNIQNSVAISPSDQGSSKLKLEDALGVVRELPYEWFRYWEPFEGLLHAQFKDAPGRRKVLAGDYQIVHKRRPGISIDKDEWTMSIAPGSELLMLIVFSALSFELISCPRPSCSGRPSLEICKKELIECHECGLKYFPRRAAFADSREELNIINDKRIGEEQIEEDTELFGDRPAPPELHERPNNALGASQNSQDQIVIDDGDDVDISPIENDFLVPLPVRPNGNTLRNPSKPAKFADLVVVGGDPKIFARDIHKETSPTCGTEPEEGLPDCPDFNLGQGSSPLLAWLDQIVPAQNPTTIHCRRQERVDLQREAKTQEMVEIEKVRNVLIMPSFHGDEKDVAAESRSNEETQMPFGARIYYRNIVDRFPSAPKFLATRLAEANWARANRLRFAKFPTFSETNTDPSESQRMGVDSSASSISIHDLSHRSIVGQPKSPTTGSNHLLLQSGRPARGQVCLVCNRSFQRVKQLTRHQRRMHSVTGNFKCPACPSNFDKEHHCERHWHFEHSNVTHRCPECLKKLQPNLLRDHVQQKHPNSIFALFGLRVEECKSRESPNKADYSGLKQPFLSDTGRLGDYLAPGYEEWKTTGLPTLGGSLSVNDYASKRCFGNKEPLRQLSCTNSSAYYDQHLLSRIGKPASPPSIGGPSAQPSYLPPISPAEHGPAMQQRSMASTTKGPNMGGKTTPPPLPPPRFMEDATSDKDRAFQWPDRAYVPFENPRSPPRVSDPSSLKLSTSRGSVGGARKKDKFTHSRRNSTSMVLRNVNYRPTGDHKPQSPYEFHRAGSASSLNFWSGSRRGSLTGSVVSSMNDSLHGYEVFDAEEQNMASPILAPKSARGSGSGAGVSGFRLPPPPTPLGKLSSFECDICGETLRIKQKREWRRHVLEDLEPYICTFEACSSPLQAFSRRRDFIQHEKNVHGTNPYSLYICRLHEYYHANEIGASHEFDPDVLETVVVPTCPLCQDPVKDHFERHIGLHMEEISFAVVTKPYEVWDFYDGSSGNSDVLSNFGAKVRPKKTYMCECCPKKPKKFEGEEERRMHMMEKQYKCAFCHNCFKNKDEAERHQNSLHLRRHSWSCAAISGFEAAFHPSTSPTSQTPGGPSGDACGYCGEEFPNFPLDWEARIEHLTNVHKFGECNQTKKFFRADHFRQHLKHSHASTSRKWTNMLENACMKDEPPTDAPSDTVMKTGEPSQPAAQKTTVPSTTPSATEYLQPRS